MDTTHNNPTEKQTRPPVVVVLGHVDHGKTTLLDKIRSTDVAAREAGGITQHLGAYQIEWQKKPITFLDTPGHETFSKMRSRGAAVADVAILVVAADDGPRLQTVEALSAIQSGKIPFVVALNKVDKPTADIDRAKAKLAEIGVLLEGWGGTVPVVALSAKEGRGIDELLETVFLLAELAELSYNPAAAGEGVVIESHLDSKRGPAATLLIRDGVLRRGAFVQAGTALAPVRIMEGTDGNALDEASASMPVVIAGFSEVPLVGVQFALFSTKREAEERAEASRAAAGMQGKSFGKAEIGVMIKADVAGSFEALFDEIKKAVPEEVAVRFFEGGVGDIGEGDVKAMAAAKIAFIVGFRVKTQASAVELASRAGATVRTFEVIHEAADWMKEEFAKYVPKKIVREELGKLLVLKIFGASQAGRILGGRMKSGRAEKGAHFDVLRAGEKVFSGTAVGLQRNKIAVDELREGEEGGLLVHVPKAVEERDTLLFYRELEA